MAAKKTATKKTGSVGRARKAQTDIAAASTGGSTAKYASIGDVMRAAGKGALPRGSKFVVDGGTVRLRVETRHTGHTLYEGPAAEVAFWGLRKAGHKAIRKAA